MTFVIEGKRKAVIEEPGHVLVLGGPGAGKTTLAILKAQERMQDMRQGQTVLFLSFSRAAVHQIIQRCRGVLSADEFRRIDVRTYHAFCWELLRSHGRALRGFPLVMITPGHEGAMRTQFVGDWNAERRRLLDTEGRVSFDAFAHAAARLVEESKKLRHAIADIYPLIILDEFQDTDDDQWRLVHALSTAAKCVFLADPDQRIYTFRPGVCAERLAILKNKISLKETDLEVDNFRSPDSDVLRYANAVQKARAPSSKCHGVSLHTYRPVPNVFNSAVLFHVGRMFGELRKREIANPSVAVLASSNDLVADISEALSMSRTFQENPLKPIAHDIAWDAELSATAALCVSALLEQGSNATKDTRKVTLDRIAAFWLQKKDWCEQHKAVGDKAAAHRAAILSTARIFIDAGKSIRADAPRLLAEYQPRFTGDPIADWAHARTLLASHKDLKEIATHARMIHVVQGHDAVAMALSRVWASKANYMGALRSVTAILDQQRLIGGNRPTHGCMLMTLHKSKGKEFDGVVIVEGFRGGALLKADEAPAYEESRRVLRVGITRARHAVCILRPNGATHLFTV